MLKGNLMVDALLGMLVITFCMSIICLCVQSFYQVEQKRLFFSKWQVDEYACEVWCDSFWFYDD